MGRRRNWQGTHEEVNHAWADWRDPVVLSLAGRRTMVIDNPADALIYIFNKWPCPVGKNAETAKAICSRVLRRKASTEDARTAFLAAVLDAQIITQ